MGHPCPAPGVNERSPVALRRRSRRGVGERKLNRGSFEAGPAKQEVGGHTLHDLDRHCGFAGPFTEGVPRWKWVRIRRHLGIGDEMASVGLSPVLSLSGIVLHRRVVI